MKALRSNILGVGVNTINMPQAVEKIEELVCRGRSHYVCVTGVHGVVESQRDARLRQIHNAASLVTPDGMPLVWASHMMGYRWVDQVCGSDLMLEVCKRTVSKGYRHFLYGGAPGVPERLAERLRKQIPGLQICGVYSPPYRELTNQEDEEIVRLINEANPHIVWVGLSTPKQEYWMSRQVGNLNSSLMIGVGAAFDFHAGLKPRAPVWMRHCGLEWLFRLCCEPKRLWRRYLFSIPLFAKLIVLQLLRLRRFRYESEEIKPIV